MSDKITLSKLDLENALLEIYQKGRSDEKSLKIGGMASVASIESTDKSIRKAIEKLQK